MQWQKSESLTRPIDVEPTGAGKFFVRKNIHEVVRVDEAKEYSVFKYDEAVATENELSAYQQKKLQSKIDFLAMMTEVNLNE